EIVVDRLRHADDRDLELAVQLRRDTERVLAADRDERVELLERGAHRVDAAVDLVRVRAGRADDRAAAPQDPRHLLTAQRLEQLLDHPAPAFAHADDVVTACPRTARDRANDGVQTRTIAAARQHPDPHLI